MYVYIYIVCIYVYIYSVYIYIYSYWISIKHLRSIHCIQRGRHLHRHLGFFEPVDFVRFTRGPLARCWDVGSLHPKHGSNEWILLIKHVDLKWIHVDKYGVDWVLDQVLTCMEPAGDYSTGEKLANSRKMVGGWYSFILRGLLGIINWPMIDSHLTQAEQRWTKCWDLKYPKYPKAKVLRGAKLPAVFFQTFIMNLSWIHPFLA